MSTKKETKTESLNVDEAAKFAKVGTRIIYAALRGGFMEGKDFGGSTGWRTNRSNVNKWIEKGFKTGNDDEVKT